MAIDCKAIAKEIKDECRDYLSSLNKSYYLKIIQVAGDDASNAYTRGKKKDCEEIGLNCQHVLLPNNSNFVNVYVEIMQANDDPDCCGIILQLPLPDHLKDDAEKLTNCIYPEKDVDGFLANSPFNPCTPEGILYIMKHQLGNNLAGKTVLIVGRGKLVGKPLAQMLDKENMTIIQANSYTPRAQLAQLMLFVDTVITATGMADTVDAKMGLWLRDETVVIDAGINRDENGKMCGDCNPAIANTHDKITTVPGGVGLMTRAMLMKNCIESIKQMEN